jgi:hypothetical protein
MKYRRCGAVLAGLILLVAQRSAPAQEVELRRALRNPPDEQPAAPFLNEDLHKVSEVLLTSPFKSSSGVPGWTIDNIIELNKDDPDGFMKALIAARTDLRGLPFLLGKDYRMAEKQALYFSRTAELVKTEVRELNGFGKEFELIATRQYWRNFEKKLEPLERSQIMADAEPARVTTAALMQILMPGSTQQKVDSKQVVAVRELVRVNHQRNCLLYHAPEKGVPPGVLTARMPLSDEPLVPGPDGYRGSAPTNFAVRIDVTYLRQDFSLMMRVEDARPWPEFQRFDFLVRTRVLTAAEAAEYEKQIAKQGTPPSHAAAQSALRELTGHAPADPTPKAWRELLKLQ